MLKLIRTTTIPSSMRGLLTGQLQYMTQFYEVIAISSGGEEYEKMLEEQHVRGYVVPFTRKTFSLFSDVKVFFLLIKIFRNEHPFIVHSHTSKDGLLCMVAAWLCGVPNRLYTIAGLADLKGVRGYVLNVAEWVTFKCATKLYPNSAKMMEIYLMKKMFKRDKAKVILYGSSNGIDTQYYSCEAIDNILLKSVKETYRFDPKIFTFVFIGRIVADKGINELIEAFTLLNKEISSTRLLLIGRYEPEIDPLNKETLININSNQNIITCGYQQDIRPFLMISDALVHPSYREGMPNVVLQAGSLNKASIVTDINGCNEIIMDMVNGNIIPRKDVQALYKMMKFYSLNQKKVREMGDRARLFVIEKFERATFWKALLEEYKSLE